jgi:hypothetical protein
MNLIIINNSDIDEGWNILAVENAREITLYTDLTPHASPWRGV